MNRRWAVLAPKITTDRVRDLLFMSIARINSGHCIT
jgi:hypothetical protein